MSEKNISWEDIVENIVKSIKCTSHENASYVLSGKSTKELCDDNRFNLLQDNKLYRMENGIIDEA